MSSTMQYVVRKYFTKLRYVNISKVEIYVICMVYPMSLLHRKELKCHGIKYIHYYINYKNYIVLPTIAHIIVY